jgi:hypothetical protein
MLYVPRHLPNKLEYKVLSCISVHYQLRMVPEHRLGVPVCLMCVFQSYYCRTYLQKENWFLLFSTFSHTRRWDARTTVPMLSR